MTTDPTHPSSPLEAEGVGEAGGEVLPESFRAFCSWLMRLRRQGRASRSRSRESSASRSSSRSRSPGVDSAAPISRGTLSTQDIYDMAFEVVRNFGEQTNEDLGLHRCYHCL